MLKKLALCALLLTTCAAAQDLSAKEVLTRLEERSASLQDAYFLLTGTVYDSDTQEYALEVDVQFIPSEELARADIYQPDALADNFIVADGDTVYNYLFVTNQVTILSADDPEALGDLLPEGQGTVNLTPDLGRFFQSDNWEASVEGYEESDNGPIYRLRFDNLDESANLDYVEAVVLEEEWLPASLSFIQTDGSPLAELSFSDYELDTGLDPAALREIPADAERIDER
jgi:outer membrane lipoprotein-sorting protein